MIKMSLPIMYHKERKNVPIIYDIKLPYCFNVYFIYIEKKFDIYLDTNFIFYHTWACK